MYFPISFGGVRSRGLFGSLFLIGLSIVSPLVRVKVFPKVNDFPRVKVTLTLTLNPNPNYRCGGFGGSFTGSVAHALHMKHILGGLARVPRPRTPFETDASLLARIWFHVSGRPNWDYLLGGSECCFHNFTTILPIFLNLNPFHFRHGKVIILSNVSNFAAKPSPTL